MTKDEILKEKPNVDDFDLQPYGYINALINYINKLEEVLTDVSHQKKLLKTTRERNIFNDGYSLGCKTTRKKYDK